MSVMTEAANGGALQKKVFLKISQISQEYTCVGVCFSFLQKFMIEHSDKIVNG